MKKQKIDWRPKVFDGIVHLGMLVNLFVIVIIVVFYFLKV